VPGNNANAGTSASAPKQNLSGFDVNGLPAGSRLLFARGGTWTNFGVSLRNLNATTTSPIVFDSYAASWGSNERPWLMTSSATAFNFGVYNDTVADGGYTIRNLKLDGRGTPSAWGLFLHNETRNVVVENMEITGFYIGIHSQGMGATGNTGLVVRNSNIHHNSEHGMLGDANDMVIEGNTFAYNNMDGGSFEHGIYLGGHGRNGIVRNNTFLNNSAPNGVCNGGNFTVHGQWDGLLIEGNRVQQDAATGGCYGMSITPGYNSAEYFRNVVIRGNTVDNVGGCGICVGAAPGVLVENNTVIHRQSTSLTAILIPTNVAIGDPTNIGDDLDAGAIVRNNQACFDAPNGQQTVVVVSGVGAQVSNNVEIPRPCAAR